MILRKPAICSPFIVGISFICIILTIIGDHGLRLLSSADISITWRALYDSLIHVFLGCLAWSITMTDRVPFTKIWPEVMMAAAISAGLDIDHFIHAGSLQLKDALHMTSPPPFHDITIPFLFFILAEVLYCTNSGRKYNLRYRFLQIATLWAVHLFRDAARRGLRIGFTFVVPPQMPFGLFPFFIPLFPVMARCIIFLTESTSFDGAEWINPSQSADIENAFF